MCNIWQVERGLWQTVEMEENRAVPPPLIHGAPLPYPRLQRPLHTQSLEILRSGVGPLSAV